MALAALIEIEEQASQSRANIFLQDTPYTPASKVISHSGKGFLVCISRILASRNLDSTENNDSFLVFVQVVLVSLHSCFTTYPLLSLPLLFVDLSRTLPVSYACLLSASRPIGRKSEQYLTLTRTDQILELAATCYLFCTTPTCLLHLFSQILFTLTMADSSKQSVHGGATPAKPSHAIDRKVDSPPDSSMSERRVAEFLIPANEGPVATMVLGPQSSAPRIAERKARVEREVADALAKLA